MSVQRKARGRWEVRWREAGQQMSRTFTTERAARGHEHVVHELRRAGHLDGLTVAKTADGFWEVVWSDQRLDRHHREYPTRAEAMAFKAEVIRLRSLGRPTDQIDAGLQTLAEYVAEIWMPDRAPRLQVNSLRVYRTLWRVHLADPLGSVPLRDITPARIRSWRDDRVAAGGGRVAVNQALVLLGSILGHAMKREEIPSNPARIIDKVPVAKSAPVVPLSPTQIELVREHAEHFDATLISVLGYAGLRPSEAWALRWGDIRERTILVERATDGIGGLKSTKNGKVRSVRILGPLAQDLARWRMASGRPDYDELIFSPASRPGSIATMADQDRWRKFAWGPAWNEAALVGTSVTGPPVRPYDLRHSCASLLLAAGHPVHWVADQMGHNPSETANRYGHIIPEFADDDAVRVDPETAIIEARETVVAQLRPGATGVRRDQAGEATG